MSEDTPNPSDELSHNDSKKIPVGRLIRSKVQNLTRVFNYLLDSNSNLRPARINSELISGRILQICQGYDPDPIGLSSVEASLLRVSCWTQTTQGMDLWLVTWGYTTRIGKQTTLVDATTLLRLASRSVADAEKCGSLKGRLSDSRR